jgi:hypothetical protein
MKKAILILIFLVLISGCAERIEEVDEEQPPEEIEEGFEWFQTGNTASVTQLQVKASEELEDNKMGDMVTLHPSIHTESPDYFVNRINEKGLKWMRISIDTFDWNEVPDTGAYSEHHVYPEQDQAIMGLNEKGIKVMHTLVFWDEEISKDLSPEYSRFQTDDEIQRYLDYAQFVVSHFKDKIEYYEILNEPNIGEGTQQYVKSADYINLVKQVVPVIRQADPNAKVVVGAVTPFIEPGAFDYLSNILSSDAIALVDGVSWHFGAGTSPEHMSEYYYNYPNLLQDITETASANGFEGEYIAEELHWRTFESPHPSEYDKYSKTDSAKYLSRGIVMILGMGFRVGSAECLECQPKMTVFQVLSNIMAGAEPADLAIEIQSEAENIRSYGFSLPNGDKLIALWTDGIALDDDPEVNADLSFDGFSGKDVIGVDILNSYQQNIIINGNKIENLIVRDYPMILQIKNKN